MSVSKYKLLRTVFCRLPRIQKAYLAILVVLAASFVAGFVPPWGCDVQLFGRIQYAVGFGCSKLVFVRATPPLGSSGRLRLVGGFAWPLDEADRLDVNTPIDSWSGPGVTWRVYTNPVHIPGLFVYQTGHAITEYTTLSGTKLRITGDTDARIVCISIWLQIILCIPIVISIRRAVVKLVRQSRGYCAFCGYDLRGGGDRCPECGKTTRKGETCTPSNSTPT